MTQKEHHVKIQKTERQTPFEHRGSDWSDASTSQRMPSINGNTRSWEEARKDPHLEPAESMALPKP